MGTGKKGIALVFVTAAVAWIPGAGAAAAKRPECVSVPAGINNQSVLGHDVPGIKDVKICVHTDAGVTGQPQVRHYEGCGDPCFAVVVRDLAAAFDVQLSVSYTLGGTPQPAESLGIKQTIKPLEGTHQCVYSHYDGGYNPCRDGVSAPSNLEALGRKSKITLEWDKAFAFGDSSVGHYEVLRSATGEEGSYVPIATTTNLTVTDSGLPAATTYWYTVAAIDDRGNRSGTPPPVSGSTR